MKTACIWLYTISFLYFFNIQSLIAQPINDSISIRKEKTPLTLRFGIDLLQPILGQFDKTLNGFEFIGDLKIKKNIYITKEDKY